jgi:hypothetical protein
MDEQNPYLLFDDEGYIEPKQEEKDALIDKLQSGDFSLSYSSLSAFSVSPRAFIAYKLKERATTKAMILGEAVHCKVLEPDTFADRYYIAPTVNAATSEGKNTWAAIYMDLTGDTLPQNKVGNYVIPKIDDLIAAVKLHTMKVSESGHVLHPGITILPGAVNDAAEMRARMLIKNRATRWVIDQITEVEHPISFDFCGIKFKGRVDGFGRNMICDIKNMPDATLKAAKYTIIGRKMYWQAFCYDTALGYGHDCYILAVDGNGETSAHLFDKSHLEKSAIEMGEYCEQFKALIEESFLDRSVWDQSQDFWLRSEYNPQGINVLK